jgi:type IV pilus assembly protein PilX
VRTSYQSVRRQRGAALVIGLLLLTVITLLAIGGMNSASIELVLAGNTQRQARAFQASEVGIERTVAYILTPSKFLPGQSTSTVNNQSIPGSTDKYSYTLVSSLKGAAQPAIWGNSWNSFSTYHFQIDSVGTSSRGTSTTHQQGMARLSPYNASQTGNSKLE